MTKKELCEVRKTVSNFKESSLSDINLCYVSSEKEKVLVEKLSYLAIPEEETFKYLELFKKTLSGGFGKTLFHINMEDGGKEREMLAVMQSTDKEEMNAFFDGIIENYNEPGNFLIVAAHGFYDYAGRLSDGSFEEDSENTYEYLLTVICPVELSKPGLSYKDGSIKDRIRDWVVGQPKDAILFPTFTDRTSNVHEVLYYSKNNKENQEGFLDLITGNKRPNSESEDKAWFSESIKEDKDIPCSFDVVRQFQDKARDILVNTPNDDEVLKSADELKKLLEDSGMDEECAEKFVEFHTKYEGERTEVALNNLTDTSKSVIKGCDFTLKVDAEKLLDIQTKNIDGRTCLVIPLNSSNMELNGIECAANKMK